MLLQLDRVSKAFDGLHAVNSVSLDVPEGQLLGLIGPNGSGKTTLFNLIAGVHLPTSGRILFDGTDISSAAAHIRCWLGIARTFQLVRPFSSTDRDRERGSRQGLRSGRSQGPRASRERIDEHP